jgi:hypothetical protein
MVARRAVQAPSTTIVGLDTLTLYPYLHKAANSGEDGSYVVGRMEDGVLRN